MKVSGITVQSVTIDVHNSVNSLDTKSLKMNEWGLTVPSVTIVLLRRIPWKNTSKPNMMTSLTVTKITISHIQFNYICFWLFDIRQYTTILIINTLFPDYCLQLLCFFLLIEIHNHINNIVHNMSILRCEVLRCEVSRFNKIRNPNLSWTCYSWSSVTFFTLTSNINYSVIF